MQVQPWKPGRKIKYAEDHTAGFLEEIAEAADCEELHNCIQCGTCSGTCPLSIYMDYTPRRLIAMTREGLKDDVLRSFTIWLCASCYECTVECPRKIRVTDVMYALKQRAIKEKVYPKGFMVPVLAREFFGTVQHFGRNHETLLLLMMYLKTNIFLMVKQAMLGLGLFLKGRLPILPERIKAKPGQKGDLGTILKAVDNNRR